MRMGIPWANTGKLPDGEDTIGELLQQQGYRTGHFGKWHLGTSAKPSKTAIAVARATPTSHRRGCTVLIPVFQPNQRFRPTGPSRVIRVRSEQNTGRLRTRLSTPSSSVMILPF